MKINITDTKVLKLLITDFDAAEDIDDQKQTPGAGKARFSVDVSFDTDCFYVTFDLTLITEEQKTIHVVYESEFHTDREMDETFRKGNFPYVNAPAIAYPFLRAFISNLTLNCGYSPVMLPSVNFVELRKNIDRSEDL
ncbi:protein-export chaperone SecB [Stutzerimonas stutzeri]|uniref:protein-export chaperone SecB n=1 Tax=Stutzerimonas TaxID=2901164 RepID=UPI001BAFE58B|nr:protein-export chaperone SecB [Stutzerimonas stutzeri]QUE76220.1 protein-export chaperone SecB [Stutzerimonas stutzeri]